MQINTNIVSEFLTLEYNRGLSYYAMFCLQLVDAFHMKPDTIILSKSLWKAHLIYNLQKRNIVQYGTIVYY